jgi:hypothetical protein
MALMKLEEIEAMSRALREKHEAWTKANPNKAAYALVLWEQRISPIFEEELDGVREAAAESGTGLTNRDRREMVRKQKRFQRQIINEKFFEYQKAVSRG